MDFAAEFVGKDFIVLRSQEALEPALLTDGQLLAQLTGAEQDANDPGNNEPENVHARLSQLLDEVRRRCLRAEPPK